MHASILPEQTLADLAVDAVGIGQGDETIVELVRAWGNRDFSAIPGVCYRRNGGVVRTKPRPLKPDLDHLPVIPDRTLLPDPDFIMEDRLAGTTMRMTHVMIAQGCPFKCHFCAAQQRKLQYRSGQHIRQELVHLRDAYGIQGFAVVGDNFLVDERRVREICDAIGDLGLKWSTLSRVDTVNPEILRVMRDAGCIEIKFGIESGSQRILDAMGKRITVQQIYDAVQTSHFIGIGAKAFIIHGYPGEDAESTRETIRMMRDLESCISRVSLFRFVPLPGSKAYDELQHDFSQRGMDWNQCHIHHNTHH